MPRHSKQARSQTVSAWLSAMRYGKVRGHRAMTKKLFSIYAVLVAVALALPLLAAAPSSPEFAATEGHAALKDAVILIIRHAEKPEAGFELSPAGQKRAEAYPHYFKDFTLDSKPVK